jgi:hypothetical protein
MARSLMRKDDLVAVATAYNEGKSEGDANSAYHKVRTVLLERHPEMGQFDEPKLARRVSHVIYIAVLAGYLSL